MKKRFWMALMFLGVLLMLGTGIGLAADTRPPYLEWGDKNQTYLVDEHGKFYTYIIPPYFYPDLIRSTLRVEITGEALGPQNYQGYRISFDIRTKESLYPPLKDKYIKMPDGLFPPPVNFKIPVLGARYGWHSVLAEVCAATYAEDQRGKRFFSRDNCIEVITR